MYHDYLNGYYNEVQAMIKDCPHPELVQYFSRFVTVFFILTKKKILPLPTTCCWIQIKTCNEWMHVQYFLILEILLVYDLSSDIFQRQCTQITATFYGGLLHHLNASSLWVSIDGKMVTTVCPAGGGGLFA